MKNSYNLLKLSILMLVITSLSSCKKDDPDEAEGYTVPTTYNFTRVNYSGQTNRLDMTTELINLMKTSKTGAVVNAQDLKNMFSNTGNPFADTVLNSSGKQLKNKCYITDQTLIETYFDSLALASTSVVPGGDGVAGVVVSTTDPTKMYCLNANGFDYTEMAAKTIMGSCFYYQALNTYLENISIDDNTTIDSVNGTAMEHHFDEAFGYFGVPINFPTNTVDARYWGKYCNDVNAVLSSNNMMNYFLTARAAITNKDYPVRDANIYLIKTKWDLLVAACVIHELNKAMVDFTDDALRNHLLSEAIAFVHCFKYNLNTLITNTQINDVLNLIGTNLYQVSLADITAARDMVSTIYNLDSVKTIL